MSSPSDCARAATAEEARYRVNYPNSRPRASKVVALDEGAWEIARTLERASWNGARFFAAVGRSKGTQGLDAIPVDLDLRESSGKIARLTAELGDADVVVMIASAGESPADADVIGKACAERGIMTTAILVEADADPIAVERTLTRLRPNARMLVVASDADYVPEMLSALRA